MVDALSSSRSRKKIFDNVENKHHFFNFKITAIDGCWFQGMELVISVSQPVYNTKVDRNDTVG